MRCEEIMKRDVQCVGPGDAIQKAASIMRDANVGFLPVCDANKKVSGAITDRDIVIRAVAKNQNIGSIRVQDVMSRDVISCRPNDDLEHAEDLMEKNQKSRMIVCSDDGVLLGVISLSDIAQAEQGDRAAGTLRGVSAREVGQPQQLH